MVSTPLLLTNLKLLSVVNSDSQKAVTAALLHATHHHSLSVCVHMCIHLSHLGTYEYYHLQNAINHCNALCSSLSQRELTNPILVLIQVKTCLVFWLCQVHWCTGSTCDL